LAGAVKIPFLSRVGAGRTVDEHFVPSGDLSLDDAIRSGEMSAVHHLVRYEWASSVLCAQPVGTVLDLATGSGYGAAKLAEALPNAKVLGVDYDPSAVAEARRRYARPNLAFRVGDATRWDETIGSGLLDVVVAFDMIEHVVHREIMLEGLVRHLAPSGALLLSTPCGWDETRLEPEWIHHRIEYSAASLYDFLRRYFEEIVRPEDAAFPRRDVFDRLAAGSVTYALKLNPVICRRPVLFENPYRPLRP